jgi:hypothetical protein
MNRAMSHVAGLVLFITSILSVCGIGVATVPAGNLFVNPTFIESGQVIPPTGWTIYEQLDAARRLSVINADDPEQRALLMEDMAIATGKDGEIGIYQTIDAGPGSYQAELTVRGVPGTSGAAFFQIRFLPSQERQQVRFLSEQLATDSFENIIVSGVAPEGTTQVRVYLYTGQTVAPSLAIQSITLINLDEVASEAEEEEALTNRVFYVSPSGRDSGSGSQEDPWASLQAAVRNARAGDTVIFLPGVYVGTLSPMYNGAPGAPITFRSATRHGAILKGAQTAISVNGVSYINFEGFRVAPESAATWAQIQKASYIQIKDFLFENSTSGVPFTIRDSEQIQVRDSIFRHWSQDWSITDPVGIDTFRVYNSKHILIEGNAFSHGLHTPLAVRPQYEGRNEYIVVRGNIFHNGYGRNYEFFGTDMLLFEDNIITNGLRGARSADSANKFSPERGIYRYNRVFRNWGGPERMMAGYIDSDLQTVHDVRVYNNIFVDNVAFGFQLASTSGKDGKRIYLNNIIAGNDVNGTHTQIYGSVGERFEMTYNALWVETDEAERNLLFRQSPYDRLDNSLIAPPLFVDDARFNFNLQADSTLRDAGRFLTSAIGSGKGTVVQVADATYFYDGYGIVGEVGDLIAVGSATNQARIIAINREKNELTLDRELTWQDNDPVGFPWTGAAPDIGVYEYGTYSRPTVYIDVSAVELNQGEPVWFTAVCTGIDNPVQYEWRLADGAIHTGAMVTHVYSEPGDYPVFVQVTDANGTVYRGSTYVVVRQDRTDTEDVLLHFTFDASDTYWWKVWKAYKPLPAQWSRVLDRSTGAGYLLVQAPNGEAGTLPAWIHPGGWDLDPYIWWNIDQFPYVDIRYRIEPGTPVGLYLETFGGGQGPLVVLAGTRSHQDSSTRRAGNTLLIDDGQWHEITVDTRWIRQVFPEVQVLQGIGFQTGPNNPSIKGSYAIDEVLIHSAAKGVVAPLVQLRTSQGNLFVSGQVQVDLSVELPLEDALSWVTVDWAGERIYADKLLPDNLYYDTGVLANGVYPLQVQVTTQSGNSGIGEIQVQVRNWWEKVDNLLPPVLSTWFGDLDRSQTSSKSAGWTYATDNPEAYADDADRMVWNGLNGEYLEWVADSGQINNVTVDLYTTLESIESVVALATTADGATWQTLPYTVEEVAIAAQGWRKFVVRGEVAKGAGAGWVRLSLSQTGTSEPRSVQIGKINIVGRTVAE